MATANPVTQADKDRVKELHAQGLPRNEIARQLGRSGKTISRIAVELGLSFERSGATAAATAAKVADAAGRRAELQLNALEGALKLYSQMFSETTVYNFGGKENDYNERKHPEPPFRDKQAIALSMKALTDMALRLAEFDKATGDENEKSMLVDLRNALITVRAAPKPPAEEQT